MLFESTGLYGKSKVRKLNPDTGDVLASVDMDTRYFGEGMTYIDGQDKLVQITWKEKKGFVYNASTLQTMTEFDYRTHTTEGWGITFITESQQLVVSDGSMFLHFWDLQNLREIRRIKVQRKDGSFVEKINELEYVSGWIFANIWYEDIIIKVDPVTGLVEQDYNFSSLWPRGQRTASANCFNGISASDNNGELYVTGKKWPQIYRIKVFGV